MKQHLVIHSVLCGLFFSLNACALEPPSEIESAVSASGLRRSTQKQTSTKMRRQLIALSDPQQGVSGMLTRAETVALENFSLEFSDFDNGQVTVTIGGELFAAPLSATLVSDDIESTAPSYAVKTAGLGEVNTNLLFTSSNQYPKIRRHACEQDTPGRTPRLIPEIKSFRFLDHGQATTFAQATHVQGVFNFWTDKTSAFLVHGEDENNYPLSGSCSVRMIAKFNLEDSDRDLVTLPLVPLPKASIAPNITPAQAVTTPVTLSKPAQDPAQHEPKPNEGAPPSIAQNPATEIPSSPAPTLAKVTTLGLDACSQPEVWRGALWVGSEAVLRTHTALSQVCRGGRWLTYRVNPKNPERCGPTYSDHCDR